MHQPKFPFSLGRRGEPGVPPEPGAGMFVRIHVVAALLLLLLLMARWIGGLGGIG